MLSQAKIASPCTASWEQMKGDDHIRFCNGCQKNVYDLSSLTSVEAEALLREKEGDLCARFYRRNDGTIMTSDCSVGVRRKWATRAAAAAAVFGSAGLALKMQVMPNVAMGDVAPYEQGAPVAMGSIAPPSSPPPSDPPTQTATQTATPPSNSGTPRQMPLGHVKMPPHVMGGPARDSA